MMSPTIRFFGYTILEDIGYNLSNINLLYQDFPNSDGILICAAIIIPTYRRIFAYSEICDAMGIELDENLVKNYIQGIDNNSLGGQEVLYATLLDKKYKSIDLKEEIEKQIKKLYEQYETMDEIKDGNFFDCFSLLYTLSFYGKKDNKLFKKCLLYCEDSDYKDTGIVQVIKKIIELKYADPDKELVLDNSFADNFSDNSVVIDSYYWYVTYLNDAEKNVDGKEIDSIIKEIEKYHGDEGSWQSDIFKSINIFRTYQYLYIKQVLQKN